MGNQADSCLSGELELILELHYSGQQQGWGGVVEWGPWERYACVNGWKNTGLALAQLTSTRLNLYGLGENKCTAVCFIALKAHERRAVTAAHPSNGRDFVKACVHFIKP